MHALESGPGLFPCGQGLGIRVASICSLCLRGVDSGAAAAVGRPVAVRGAVMGPHCFDGVVPVFCRYRGRPAGGDPNFAGVRRCSEAARGRSNYLVNTGSYPSRQCARASSRVESFRNDYPQGGSAERPAAGRHLNCFSMNTCPACLYAPFYARLPCPLLFVSRLCH